MGTVEFTKIPLYAVSCYGLADLARNRKAHLSPLLLLCCQITDKIAIRDLPAVGKHRAVFGFLPDPVRRRKTIAAAAH